ncbi:LysR family substrate-binding domain-containing protein [Streptomyces sp. NPDC090306]|uniref:LysR family substrate-binding domain-containing protein n=1 Tax=Streptomyces sp. NPDC090306 TaxID=3365961 RepID=UPI003813A066
MSGSEVPRSFRLAYVPGATPSKWVRVWNERRPDTALELVPVAPGEAAGLLGGGEVDAGIVRLPVDRTRFSAIPLYTETTVVIVPKDHLLTAADEVTVEDLADEVVLHPLDDTLGWDDTPPGEPAFERPATTEDAVELVAAGIGVLLVPQSLARLHHRRDLTYRPMGEDVPRSSVALCWPEDATTDDVDDFIGIVRGRTANSTRGRDRTSGTAASDGGGRGAKGTSAQKASPARSGGRSGGGKAGNSKAGSGRAGGGKAGGARRSSGSGSGSGSRGKPRRRS